MPPPVRCCGASTSALPAEWSRHRGRARIPAREHVVRGQPGSAPVAPLYDISTIFYFTDKPDPVPENAAVGLIVHLALSAGFGVVLAAFAPLVASGRCLAAGALTFGLLLYLVNFQILGRLVFEWFQEGPNETFEVFAHIGYGLLLAPFLAGYSGAGEGVRVGGRARPAGRRVVPD
jgi:hypothetical protein